MAYVIVSVMSRLWDGAKFVDRFAECEVQYPTLSEASNALVEMRRTNVYGAALAKVEKNGPAHCGDCGEALQAQYEQYLEEITGASKS